MEKACYSISRLFNPVPTACSKPKTHSLSLGTYSCPCSNVRASKKDEVSQIPSDFKHHECRIFQSLKKNSRKRSRTPRRLITISTTDGRWQGQWTNDYIFSLRQLQLEDLAEEGQKDTEVSIHLAIQKHTGFGFSVDGRIITSFTRKCSNCFSPYCREVIYAKPGSEVDLDSLIQETLRLTTSVKVID
ncbi:large ribosomal RNA subunit accumulation protein YCED 2, chloroplastic isoform X3 [Cinnamomum micranthum f. kanehirae]|uniref:Large ribosomal RNA subunit accumulation protein YCED 2, chloroplastic isoform X3 n=1 Tax=Cinnamomum micranthum f. kanehirae TaxID=337451 RepID=A0A3S4PH78_9MAGN|nr:large ribosomal RNA subunit accumulation protein YCED 2, chloroplastic isoform X3 [Cinnamomum micranthum f. kanehirae]